MTAIPLFVSNRTLMPRKGLPRALGPWMLDSGGFSELSLFGEWRTSPQRYVELTSRYADEIGNMEWAAIQDWMCEPQILNSTGLSLKEHQLRTIRSYQELTQLDSTLPWLPVIQGWSRTDYLRHIDLYEANQISLKDFPLVGVGSVCRRQSTDEIGEIVQAIAEEGITIHAFGVKKRGLKKYQDHLTSTDSMAWSYQARYADPLPGHTTHKNCANCLDYALKWRRQLLEILN